MPPALPPRPARGPLWPVLALALAAAPGAAAPAEPAGTVLDWLHGVQLGATQGALLALRSVVDLTYEAVTVDRRTGDVVVSGLTLLPEVAWDPKRRCRIRAARLVLVGRSAGDGQRLDLSAEADRLTVPAECLQPAVGLMVGSFGYGTLELEDAALRLEFELPSGAARLYLDGSVPDAATVAVSADFDYLWLRDGSTLPPAAVDATAPGDGAAAGDRPAAVPVAVLSRAEVTVENTGLYERLAPLLMLQFGGPDAAAGQLRGLLAPLLEEAGGRLGPGASAFVDNLASELSRFMRDGDQLVLTLAPEGGVRLDDGLFQTPERAVAALAPRVSATAAPPEGLVSPAALRAALDAEGDLPEAARRRIGLALISGEGAPLNRAAGIALLEPLAASWDAEAAAAIAEALLALGEPARAYPMALRALAGQAARADALADRAEAAIDTGALLAAQQAAFEAWPGRQAWQAATEADEAAGAVSALARRGRAASEGRQMPRSYANAYRLASLAATAGDRGAAILRGRIDARLSDLDGVADPAWAALRADVEQAVLEAWMQPGGFGPRVMRTLREAD